MASTFTTNFAIEKPGTGEQSGTWGTTTNLNLSIYLIGWLDTKALPYQAQHIL